MRPVACYLSTAHVLINGIRWHLGLEAKTALLTEVGMNINCYINAKVYFKMACVRVRVRVRVHVRAYPHFPTTPLKSLKSDYESKHCGRGIPYPRIHVNVVSSNKSGSIA